MYRPHIRGRNRLLTQPMKVQLCELVAESCTIEQAAETLDVSVRTVQRERKDDEDFDHELRLSLQAAPDPKKLMESAARTHWRAAAWLLERTDPERYGRRPISSASPQQVEAALKFVTEAALKAAAPDRQNETYDQVRAACDHAFKCLFPNLGPWGSAKNPKLPPTPLADQQEFRQVDDYALANIVPDFDEAGNILPIVLPTPPAPPTAEELAQAQAKAEERARLKELLRQQREAEEAAARINAAAGEIADDNAREGILSPKIDFATEFHPPRRDLGLLLGCFEHPPQPAESSEGKNGILSPKTSFATEFNDDDQCSVQRLAPVAAPAATGAAQPQEAKSTPDSASPLPSWGMGATEHVRQ